MSRYVHFVGSLPPELMADGDRAALEWFVDHSGGKPLTAVPCDLDPDWILDYLRARREHADVLELVSGGEFADYSDFPSYGIRSGRKLEPGHVSMDRIDRIDEVMAAFESLQRDRPELAGAKLQISQPSPLDLAMFVFAGAAVSGGLPTGRALRRSNLVLAALRHLPVFTDAVLREMTEIARRHGDRILWQIESPLALLSVVKAQDLRMLWAMAPMVARQLAGFLEQVHRIEGGNDTIVHLCYGDYQHQSLLSPRDLTPATTLLRHTGTLLRQRKIPLPPVHLPCAYGSHPAPVDPAFYAPLRSLDPEWRLIAGVASPDTAEGGARALSLFEQAAGRAYGISAACGLGRHSAEEARVCAAGIVALADAEGPAEPDRDTHHSKDPVSG